MNLGMNADNIDNLWDALGYLTVGSIAGAGSAAIGMGVSGVLSIGGFGGGAITGGVSGFAGGFTSGAGNTWVGGGSFSDGMVSGFVSGNMAGLSGSVLGGLSAGIYASQNQGSFWNGDGTTFESYTGTRLSPEDIKQAERAAKEYNPSLGDEILLDRVENEVGVTTGQYGLTEITTGMDPRSYGLTKNNYYVNLDNGMEVWGYVRANSNITSSMHISPGITYDFVSPRFIATVGHELTHAYHIATIGYGTVRRPWSEKVAYDYSNRILSQGNYIKWITSTKYNIPAIYNSPSVPSEYILPKSLPWMRFLPWY